jgi:hypothetical protein
MEEPRLDGLDPASRRALYRRALVRPLLTVTALVALYYLLPLDRWHDPLTVVAIAGGLLAVVGLGALQVRAILRARYPAVQAVEALAVAVPLFLLLFAAGSWSLCRWWAICWFSVCSCRRSWERSSSVAPGGGTLGQTDHLTPDG